MKFVPVDVEPGMDNGCPCHECDCRWRQLTYADGFTQRDGICPYQYGIITSTKAGMVPPECPKKDEGGRVVDEDVRRWEDTNISNEEWEDYVKRYKQGRGQADNCSTKPVVKETIGGEGAFS